MAARGGHKGPPLYRALTDTLLTDTHAMLYCNLCRAVGGV